MFNTIMYYNILSIIGTETGNETLQCNYYLDKCQNMWKS